MMVPRLGAVGYAASASNEGRLPSLTLGGQALAAFFVRLAAQLREGYFPTGDAMSMHCAGGGRTSWKKPAAAGLHVLRPGES